MIRLDPDRVRWIFVHTLAFRGDAGMDAVRRWHTDPKDLPGGEVYWRGRRYASRRELPEGVRSREGNGWDDAGYHEEVRRDGSLELGRPLEYAGAHVAGVNTQSIGIACEGHGDFEPLTVPQRAKLLDRLHHHMKTFNLPVENVLGHHEVNLLIDVGLVGDQYRTGKTCPGGLIDMEAIRRDLATPQILPEPRVEPVDSGIHDDRP